MYPDRIEPIANIIFSSFVLAMQAYGASLSLLLLITSVSYAVSLMSHSCENPEFMLIPNCNSSDYKRGFEVFGELGTHILGNALLANLAL